MSSSAMVASDTPLEIQPMPSARVRATVSVLVALHVFAVFVGPWAMPPQNSELSARCADLLRPYVEGISLANGYRFFAPQPGPSHLVRYEITMPDGSQSEGVFPDRNVHWPRLLYHRYFMLSEFINSLETPEKPNERAEAVAQSFAKHLAEAHGASEVKLYLVRHFVPRMSEVQQGMRLNDKQLYEIQPLGTYKRDES